MRRRVGETKGKGPRFLLLIRNEANGKIGKRLGGKESLPRRRVRLTIDGHGRILDFAGVEATVATIVHRTFQHREGTVKASIHGPVWTVVAEVPLSRHAGTVVSITQNLSDRRCVVLR